MLKLYYTEKIGLVSNCPKITRKYITKKVLFNDYENFKALWLELAIKDPQRFKFNENVGIGRKMVSLTTIVQELNYTKTVEIEYDED